jgi:transcriptional regulator with XRE-family HTH domain
MLSFNGDFIRKRREDFGWTRQVMSLKWYEKFKSPISLQTVINWESGQKPNADNLMRLSRLLNVTMAYFFQPSDEIKQTATRLDRSSIDPRGTEKEEENKEVHH